MQPTLLRDRGHRLSPNHFAFPRVHTSQRDRRIYHAESVGHPLAALVVLNYNPVGLPLVEHRGYGFPQLWCAAPPGAQAELTASAPDRIFRPPYVGGRGWLGVRLDGDVDWAEITELCQDAYRAVAPARLAALVGR